MFNGELTRVFDVEISFAGVIVYTDRVRVEGHASRQFDTFILKPNGEFKDPSVPVLYRKSYGVAITQYGDWKMTLKPTEKIHGKNREIR